MSVADHVDLEQFMAGVERRNPGETEFIQAVREVAEDIYDFMEDKVHYHEAQILRRIAEPDRVISVRVCWEDDNGSIRFKEVIGFKTTTRSVHTRGVCASTQASIRAF